MENEIVTQLDRLVEVVQRPDWWMFGITLANTIAIIALTWYLGIRQRKIQEIQQQIQREQLRIERMRHLREIYAYITEFRSITESFCRNVYMLMFSVINDQSEQDALKQVENIKADLDQSHTIFQQLRADLIVQKGIGENLNLIEALYKAMNDTRDTLRFFLCMIYGTRFYDQVDEADKARNLKDIIATVNKLNPMYPITDKTPTKDISGEAAAEMIALIKDYLKKHLEIDVGYGLLDVDRIANIEKAIRPFNSTFAEVIKQMLITFVNLQADLFREKNIVKCIEEDIFKA